MIKKLGFISLACLLAIQFCKNSQPEMGKVLFQKFHNPVFQKLDYDEFKEVFQKVLQERKNDLNYPDLIIGFYQNNDFNPVFAMNQLPKDNLKLLAQYYQRANEHGLTAQMFGYRKMQALLDKFYDVNALKTTADAYRAIAELEVLTANSLINYSNVLEFGLINPNKIYVRYDIKTTQPDTVFMLKALRVQNLRSYLDSIQPQSPAYQKMQQALMSGYVAPGLSAEETARILQVNMERLRWKNRPQAAKYVWVNIPDFRLKVMNNGFPVLSMNVCVGEGRNMDFNDKLENYGPADLVNDTPGSHETPQLLSAISSVEVNPVWNIPQSIAKKEIIDLIKEDRYYLANNNIQVYEHGKLINSDDINWDGITKENLPYTFKQKPGSENAMGKIKFLFPNESSIYLHDTPSKTAFSRAMRAVSHGCVRLADPVGLAKTLFGSSPKLDLVLDELEEDIPTSRYIALPKKMPVFIDYETCWLDEQGRLQFRPDVYLLDVVLYTHMQKLFRTIGGKGNYE